MKLARILPLIAILAVSTQAFGQLKLATVNAQAASLMETVAARTADGT